MIKNMVHFQVNIIKTIRLPFYELVRDKVSKDDQKYGLSLNKDTKDEHIVTIWTSFQ